jgi:hypothetical protein
VVALRLPKAHPGVKGLLLLGAWPKAGRPLLLLLADLLSLLCSRPLQTTEQVERDMAHAVMCKQCDERAYEKSVGNAGHRRMHAATCTRPHAQVLARAYRQQLWAGLLLPLLLRAMQAIAVNKLSM